MHNSTLTIAALFLLATRAFAAPQVELTITPAGQPVLSWLAEADKAYIPQYSDDLVTWENEPSLPEVDADGSTYSQVSATTTSEAPRKFFRLIERAADNFAISETPSPNGAPQRITMIEGGQLRRFALFLPPTYSPPPASSRRCDDGHALAIICHGSGQTASSFIDQHPGLISKCELEEVILVFPQGTWNDVSLKYSFNSLDDAGRRDDVAFVVNLADQLGDTLWIDRDRVYIGGFSNGGILSQRAVSRSPGTFAAFTAICSSLGGQGGIGGNEPIVRVPEPIDASSAPGLIVNGRLDLARPFDGGPSNGDGPLQTAAPELPVFWRAALRCTDPVTITSIPAPGGGPNSAGQIESACAGTAKEVTFVDLARMDHIWPDAADNVGWDANREVIDFFLTHERGAIEDTVDPTPVSSPTTWTRSDFQNRSAIYHIPQAPSAIAFVAHDLGGSAGIVDDIEMVEILNGLAAEGIGFFAISSEGSGWDIEHSTTIDNPDLDRVADLHADLVATTELSVDTHIVTLGFGEGGKFALLAGEHLDGPTFQVGGIALLSASISASPEIETILEHTTEPVYFTNGENNTIAPPLPAWLQFREIAVYSTDQSQFKFTDFFPARRKRLTGEHLTRVPDVSILDASMIIDGLEAANMVDIDGNPTLCPDELDCDSLPLPTGFSSPQQDQLRKQICSAFAGHAIDASCLPSLRRFCIGARRLADPTPAPIPTSAPADPSPITPVPAVPWTTDNHFQGLPVLAYIPTSPKALVYFFHGTGGGIDFYDRLEQREMIHALHAAEIGVVCTVSTDRDTGAQWDSRPLHPDTDAVFVENPDWVRLMDLHDQLISSTDVTTDTPLFSLGFSNGGGFALTFGFLAQQTGLEFLGAAVHAQPAFDEAMFRASRRLSTGTPLFLTALANDSTAAKMPVLADMLTGLGHPVTFHIGEEVLLKPERFQRLPNFDSSDATSLFNNLVADGVIDATGLRKISIEAPVPGSTAEIKRQLRATIFANHTFSARFITEEIAWFESQLP